VEGAEALEEGDGRVVGGGDADVYFHLREGGREDGKKGGREGGRE
jgi:hypothetical protein